MEKVKRKLHGLNFAKRIIAAILMVILLIFTFPNYSNAGFITTTILNKAITGIIVLGTDSINRQLALVFKLDSMGDTITENGKKIKEIWNETGGTESEKEQSFMEKFTEAMEKTGDTIENAAYAWYDLMLSPDDIFSGKVKIANANIFKQDSTRMSEWTPFGKLMKNLKSAVAGLYYIMRNLAIVILLCLLIYSGIRIVLASSVANEKAKWKEYLYDWLKALFLVMFIHIIMIGIFYISDVVVDGLSTTLAYDHTIVSEIRIQFMKTSFFDVTSNWFYVIMYLYVTYLTVVFIVSYFKRLMYLMVLIIIAPIVSSLYAFGKTSKAIFNKWFKEFTIGVFVQPFHMLVYSILLLLPLKLMNGSGATEGTAFQINYPSIQIYALISLAMIRPIEKFMREIFQFGSTRMDNIASFESGKKTVDTGVKLGAAVVATVATAGAAAPALGAAGATAATAASAGAAGTAGAAGAAGTAGITAAGAGSMAPMGATGATSVLGTEIPELGEFGHFENFAKLGQVPGENDMMISNDPFHDDYYSGDQFFDNNLQNSNLPKGKMGEQELQEELNFYRENGYDENEITELEQQFRNQGHGSQLNRGVSNNSKLDEDKKIEKNNGKTNSDIALENANIQINNARGLEKNNNANTDSNLNGKNTETIDKMNIDKMDVQNINADNTNVDTDEDKKESIDSKELATSLKGRLAGMYEGVSEKFLNPAMLEQYEKVRQAAHEFTDSLYVPGQANADWKTTIDINKEYIEGKKQAVVNNFVKDPKNVKEAIKVFGLKDKLDKNTGEVTSAEKQAQEKLQQAAPYIELGVRDVGALKNLSEMGNKKRPDKDVIAYKKQLKEEATYKQFIQNNIQQMETIVADELGKLPEFRSGDSVVVQQVHQQVTKNFEDGRKYITSGEAKDSETLNRLVKLERKIDSKVNMGSSMNHTKTDYVVSADKIIQKAIKNNLKNIKLPVNKKDSANINKTKALEGAMNEVLKERRREITPPPKK